MGAAKIIRDFAIRLGVETDEKKLKQFDALVNKAKADLGDLVSFATKATVAIIGVGAAAIFEARRVAVLSEQIERQAAALEPGSHQVTLWPDDLDGFEICAALLTNDLSFLPGDDPQLPEAPWSYTSTSTSRSARSAHAGWTTIRSDTGECTALRPRRDSTR